MHFSVGMSGAIGLASDEHILPAWLHQVHVSGLELWQLLGIPLVAVLALLLGRAVQALVLRLLHRFARRTATTIDDELVTALKGPVLLGALSVFLALGIGALDLPQGVQRAFDVISRSLMIFAVIWILQRTVKLVLVLVGPRHDPRRLSDRSLRTSLELTSRIFQIVIWVVGVSVFLLQFELVRSVGMSLLASAGIAGVVLGIAAQRTIAQLFAGIQLSLTQPIRLGDVVTIEGHFGEVEEVRLTYVVLRTWDLRRIVVPISKLLDITFENWSLGSVDLVASVALRLDFQADVGALRAQFHQLLQSPPLSTLWDGKHWAVLVTDADDRTMKVRFSASVADSSSSFDLSCLLREHLLTTIRESPTWLPRGRNEALVIEPVQIDRPLGASKAEG